MAIGGFLGNIASGVRNFFTGDDNDRPEPTQDNGQQGPRALQDIPDSIKNARPEPTQDNGQQGPRALQDIPDSIKDARQERDSRIDIASNMGGVDIASLSDLGGEKENKTIDDRVKEIVEEESSTNTFLKRAGMAADQWLSRLRQRNMAKSNEESLWERFGDNALDLATGSPVFAAMRGSAEVIADRVRDDSPSEPELLNRTMELFDTNPSQNNIRSQVLQQRIKDEGGDPSLLGRENIFKPFNPGGGEREGGVQTTPYNIRPIENNIPLAFSFDSSNDRLVDAVNDALVDDVNEVDYNPYEYYKEIGGKLTESQFNNEFSIMRGYRILNEKMQTNMNVLREESGTDIGPSGEEVTKEFRDFIMGSVEDGKLDSINASRLTSQVSNQINRDFAGLETFYDSMNVAVLDGQIKNQNTSKLSAIRDNAGRYIKTVKERMIALKKAQLEGQFNDSWLRNKVSERGVNPSLYDSGTLMNIYLNAGTNAKSITNSPEENLQLVSAEFNVKNTANKLQGNILDKAFALTVSPISYALTYPMILADDVIDGGVRIGREAIATAGTALGSRTLAEQRNNISDYTSIAATSLSSISNNDVLEGFEAPMLPLKSYSMGFADLSGNLFPFFLGAGAITGGAYRVSKAATSAKNFQKLGLGVKNANRYAQWANIGLRSVISEGLIEGMISRVDPGITSQNSQRIAVIGAMMGMFVEGIGPSIRLSARRSRGGWTAEKRVIDISQEINETMGRIGPDGQLITDIDTANMKGVVDFLKKAQNAAKDDPELNALLKEKYLGAKANQLAIDDAIADGIVTQSLKFEALRQGPESEAWDRLVQLIQGREMSQQTQGIINDIAEFYGDASKSFNDVISEFEGTSIGARIKDMRKQDFQSLSNRPTFLVKQSIINTMDKAGINKPLRPGQTYTPAEMRKINKANENGVGRKVDGEYVNFTKNDNGEYIIDPFKLGDDMGVQKINVNADDFSDVLRSDEDVLNAMNEINRRKQASGGVYANPSRIMQSGAFKQVDEFLSKIVC